MQFIKLYLILLFFVFFNLNKLEAATVYTSTVSGNWTVGANWINGAPASPTSASNTTMNIGATLPMTLTANYTLGSNAVLNIPANATLTIIGNVTFNNGSVLNVAAGGYLIIIGNVTNNNNSNDIKIDGTISITGNFNGGNGSEIIGTGAMAISGSVTTTGTGVVFGSAIDCTVNCSSSAASPLPIELIDFSGTCLTNGVQLKWSTATELNNDYFLIEKSLNGIDWKLPAKIGGSGTSNSMHTYIYTDNSINSNELIYYRLSQVDFDGKKTVFKMIDVNCNNNSVPDQMIFYPNPASTELNIHFDVNEPSANSIIRLVNNMGQTIMETKVDLYKGVNSFVFPVDFEPGTYTILFSSDNIIVPSQKLAVIRY